MTEKMEVKMTNMEMKLVFYSAGLAYVTVALVKEGGYL
jgi:hypothetical protein